MKRDLILVLDLGGKAARVITRKVRAASVYCESLPGEVNASRVLEKAPRGLIVVGDSGDGRCDPGIWALGVPVLGVDGGARAMVRALGGASEGTVVSDKLVTVDPGAHALFEGVEEGVRYVARADALTLPNGFREISRIEGVPLAFANEDLQLYGMQFLPEANDPDGNRILSNFVQGICKATPNWNLDAFIEESVERIRAEVGDGTALMLLSGGVDTSVCAALAHRAIGDRFKCIYVDTGLMRKGESEETERALRDVMGIDPIIVHAADRFISALNGKPSAREKREAVLSELAEVVEEQAAVLPRATLIINGTISTDVGDFSERDIMCTLSSGDVQPAVLEPLRELLKNEVRQIARILELPDSIIWRAPFPSEGLAIRCVGEVDARRIRIVREADAILLAEVRAAALEKQVSQCFAVLTDMCGVAGCTIVIRAVHASGDNPAHITRFPYDLLESVTARILAEVEGVVRIVYDLTPAAHAGVEW